MANDKLALARADVGNLITNLRGEVGEVITAWLLMRHFIGTEMRLRTDEFEKDFANKELQFATLLANKLGDELAGRLSELGENKIGQLTFHFATRKLSKFTEDARKFTEYVTRTKIRDKRNRDVSHKQLPSSRADQGYLHIEYRVLLRGVALALRLMKRIDRDVLGPSAIFAWMETRKRRYDFLSPPRVGYMLTPYLNLSPEDRVLIMQQELAEGKQVLSEISTMINGQPATVLACKQWGVVVLGDRLIAPERYPLVALQGLSISPECSWA